MSRSIPKCIFLRAQRTFLVLVSLKNPAFSNAWLSSVAADIDDFGGNMLVSLVDSPYLAVSRHCDIADEGSFEALSRMEVIKQEQERRIRRFCGKSHGKRRFVSWDILERATPSELKREIYQAFRSGGMFRAMILEQTTRATGLTSSFSITSASHFFLNEIPVLIYLYYGFLKDVIDVYPGQQADIFWAIESGAFGDELPLATQFASESEPHAYADVSIAT